MRGRSSLAAAVALSLGLGVACRQEQRAEKSPRPVRTQTVEPRAGEPRVRYSANIEPREQLNLAFKVSGYIREVQQTRGADGRMRNLQEGDRVTPGTVLARIREDDYSEAVNRARAAVKQAEAALQKATLDYERTQRLFARDSLTKSDYDAAKAAYEAAQAQTDGALASLAEAEIRLRDTALVAPTDAVILSRSIEVGTLVGAGSVGFTLADTSSVKAVFGVPDWLVRQARLGMALAVRIESLNAREFPGQITAIAPHADPASRLFEVELTIRNARGELKPGLIATVEVPEADADGARARTVTLVVPLAAIVRPRPDQFAVYAVEDAGGKLVARLRVVEVGEVFGNMVAVRKGVQQGDRVVVTGASLLTDGETVQIIP